MCIISYAVNRVWEKNRFQQKRIGSTDDQATSRVLEWLVETSFYETIYELSSIVLPYLPSFYFIFLKLVIVFNSISNLKINFKFFFFPN